MWLLNMRTLFVVAVLAVLATYAVEHFGFAIAHSMAFLCLAVLIAPGTLLAFINWGEFSEWVPMMLATVVNGAYYYLLAWVIRKLATARELQNK